MQSLEALPDFPLQPAGEVTARFLTLGVTNFHGAARHVYQLPYGRTSDRANFRLVLREGRGTSSAKHALLAQLASAQGVEVALTIGIYQMTERNTPGVGAVLEKYALPYVPEGAPGGKSAVSPGDRGGCGVAGHTQPPAYRG